MERERWGSRIGVILAVAGSAVGLGNFLRFPGQAAQNGGGAFMLPYFISLLVLGIPLAWAEWTMGRYAGLRGLNSAPGVFTVIWRNPISKYFGAVALLIPLVIYMYYVLIEAWCLGYALQYISGDLMIGSGGRVDALVEEITKESGGAISGPEAEAAAIGEFFERFVGMKRDGALLQAGNKGWLWVLAGTFAFNFFLIYRGVSKGIEKFCRVAMPLMVVLAILVLIRVLTLGTPNPELPEQSVIGGLNFMWNPKKEALADPQTWLAASGQIFFSLSVGFGIIINYASYLQRDDDVVLSGLTSSSMNEFFEVCLGGLITLPAAFIFLGAAAGSFGTFGLGFVALPNVFNQMPGGQFFGFLWFFMLFIAAVTSSVSMLQPVIAFLEEGFGLKRHASAALLGLIAAAGCGFVLHFSKDLLALDTFDFWVGTFLIYVLSMFQALVYGWVFGIKRGEEEAHRGAHIRIPRVVQYMLKYVVPIYLLTIFIAFCWEKLPSHDNLAWETEPSHTSALTDGAVPDELQQELDEQSLTVPEQHRVSFDADEEQWTVWNLANEGEEIPVLVLKTATRAQTLEITQGGETQFRTPIPNAAPAANALQNGRISPWLRAELDMHDLPVGEEIAVASLGSGAWSIRDENGGELFQVRRVAAGQPQEVLAVSQHTMGYVETLGRRPVVFASAGFLGIVMVFLLLLVFIAGRRWEAEGRFDPANLQESA